MGRDVLLLYMSPKNPNYKTQTNEGAVRYLIKEKETPDCILALCSETVRKKAVVEMPDGSTCTTLEYFRVAQGGHPGRTAGGDRSAGQHG